MKKHHYGLQRRVIAAVAAASIVAGGVLAMRTAASADGSVAGSAGIDTALPATDSAVTLPGRGRFGDMRFSVNQTKGLANQAVSVSWTGGRPGTFSKNWVQVFQCWGDDDGSRPENPGPPPEQCQFGGQPFAGNASRIPAGAQPSNVYTRVIANDNWSTFDESEGDYDPQLGYLWKPFKAVDGTVIGRQLKQVESSGGTDNKLEWQNPYFSFTTTNEDPWGKTYGNGKGSVLFQTFTGLEAPGLGCGQRTQALSDGSRKMPKCWLVVVPRGTPEEENPDNLTEDGYTHVAVSPLAASAWQHRVAVPLEFNPIESGCAIGGAQRRIVGGSLAANAVINWQPTLCAADGGSPFAYQAVGDEPARRQILARGPGAAGMAVVTHPINPDAADPDDPVTYAPVSLSGVVIGFNVERVPVDYDGQVRDPDEPPLEGIRVTNINLTPRLAAKLLTQSYPALFPNLDPNNRPTGYEWLADNPAHMFRDPDFLRFNPEFDVISIGNPRTGAGLVVEGAQSDAAVEVWRWILADGEARQWLAGNADRWGMKVNPFYSTDPALNPARAPFADPLPQTFPKNDPYCYQAPDDEGLTPRPLCMLDAAPLAVNFSEAAQQTRAANDRATTAHDQQSPDQQTAATYWGSEGPQLQGRRSIMSLTDAASAARYGLQTAALSRSGDNGDERGFFAPTDAALAQGVKAMKADPSGVLLPDPSSRVDGAYPLSMLTYAAVAPGSLDASARADYARFVTYAAGPGQRPGYAFGDLPRGYAPLPAELRAQALSAAAAIAVGGSPRVASAGDPSSSLTSGDSARDLATQSFAFSTAPIGFSDSELVAALTSPAALASPTFGFGRPSGLAGRTPEFAAGAIRYAVPIAVSLGGLALLLFLVFDTGRLRSLAVASGKHRR